MKIVRIKILFTIFLFLATVPSVTQAMEGKALTIGSTMLSWTGSNAKNFYNFLKKPSNAAMVAGGCLCSYSAWRLSKITWFFYKLYNEVNDCRRELLAKIDTGELIEDPLGEKYCLTSPDQSLVEKIRNALRYLDIPDFFIEKILILGKEYKEGDPNKRYFLEETKFTHEFYLPYAILIDNKFLTEDSSIGQEFIYLRAGWCFKDSKVFFLDESFDKKLAAVAADIFALDALIRQKKKNELPNLSQDVFIGTRPRPYLSLRELVYYGEKIFDIQQRGSEVDPLTYAQEVIAERKKDGYKQKIMGKTNCYFELSDGARDEVDRLEKIADDWGRELLAKEADDRGKELLTKVDTQELLNDDLLCKGTTKTKLSHDSTGQYYLVSLDPKFVKKARNELRLLNISGFLAENIPIVGKKYIDCSVQEKITTEKIVCLGQVASINRESSKAPWAILINTELSSSVKKFIFFHEAWHVKSCHPDLYQSDSELEEVAADVCALDAFIRWEGKDQFQNVVSDPLMVCRPNPYLSTQELVYHGGKIFDIQQRKGKLDSLSYAQEVIAERKKDGYGKKIMEKTNGFFGLFDGVSAEVDCLKKVADSWGRELLTKVDTQELLSVDDLLFKRVEKRKLSGDSLKQFQLISLDTALVEEIRDTLRFINDSNSLVKKIPILGIKYGNDHSERKEDDIVNILFFGQRFISVPYVVLIDAEVLTRSSFFVKKFNLFCNGWYVKSLYEATYETDNELNRVAADTCALDAFVRQKKKNQIQHVASDLFMQNRPKYCLSSQELVYHGEQLFAAQEKGDRSDVLAYARKIISERKEDGYEERIA